MGNSEGRLDHVGLPPDRLYEANEPAPINPEPERRSRTYWTDEEIKYMRIPIWRHAIPEKLTPVYGVHVNPWFLAAAEQNDSIYRFGLWRSKPKNQQVYDQLKLKAKNMKLDVPKELA